MTWLTFIKLTLVDEDVVKFKNETLFVPQNFPSELRVGAELFLRVGEEGSKVGGSWKWVAKVKKSRFTASEEI